MVALVSVPVDRACKGGGGSDSAQWRCGGRRGAEGGLTSIKLLNKAINDEGLFRFGEHTRKDVMQGGAGGRRGGHKGALSMTILTEGNKVSKKAMEHEHADRNQNQKEILID